MALDKFFCKVPETKVTDKQIEFHSEREANEYCKDNDIDPHNVILMGDKYIIKTKDSGFRTTREDVRCTMSKSLDKAIRLCDAENRITSGMLSQLRETLKRYKKQENRRKLVNQYIDNVNRARISGKVSEEESNSFVEKAKGMI